MKHCFIEVFGLLRSNAPSQRLSLNVGGQLTSVYCHMGDFGCGDGGWTTVMKMDGNKVYIQSCVKVVKTNFDEIRTYRVSWRTLRVLKRFPFCEILRKFCFLGILHPKIFPLSSYISLKFPCTLEVR